jgi:hypothetical protein
LELIRIHHRPIGSLDPAEHCLDFRFGSAIRSPLSDVSLELGQNGFNDSKRKAPRFLPP